MIYLGSYRRGWHQCLSTKARNWPFDLLESWTPALSNVFSPTIWNVAGVRANHADGHVHRRAKNNGNCHEACAHRRALTSLVTPSIKFCCIHACVLLQFLWFFYHIDNATYEGADKAAFSEIPLEVGSWSWWDGEDNGNYLVGNITVTRLLYDCRPVQELFFGRSKYNGSKCTEIRNFCQVYRHLHPCPFFFLNLDHGPCSFPQSIIGKKMWISGRRKTPGEVLTPKSYVDVPAGHRKSHFSIPIFCPISHPSV